MPYIDPKQREKFSFVIAEAVKRVSTPGELNYLITRICNEYAAIEPPCYALYAEITGTLEAVKQEFNRRVIVPFEEAKRAEHGDVFNSVLAPAKPTKSPARS